MIEICVDVTVPRNSSATVGKRTPRPALRRTCHSSSGRKDSDAFGDHLRSVRDG